MEGRSSVVMDVSNPFQLISKHRALLMGVAILWVMSYHTTIFIDYSSYRILYFLFIIGYGGVDMFLFLSGFGLYYSSQKSEPILNFYKKRFIRIFPAFFIVTFFYKIMNADYSIVGYLYDISTIGFWIEQQHYVWYIPCIIAFYLIFPLYIPFFLKKPYLVTLITVLSALVFIALLQSFQVNIGLLILFFIRIPIFFIGVLFGKLSLDKRSYVTLKLMLYILSIVGFLILYLSSFYYPFLLSGDGMCWIIFILIIPGLVLFLSFISEKYINRSLVYKILSYIGTISLELYLVHVSLFTFVATVHLQCNIRGSFLIAIFVLASVLVAICLHKLLNKGMSLIKA